MCLKFIYMFLIFSLVCMGGCSTHVGQLKNKNIDSSPYERMKEMFTEMVVKKDASVIPKYYHPEFLMITNEKKMDYAENLKMHQEIYATPIQYKIEYDDETVIEEKEKVAFRVFITTQRPSEAPKRIEAIIIAHYRDGKIYRVWELTYPDWSKLPAFR